MVGCMLPRQLSARPMRLSLLSLAQLQTAPLRFVTLQIKTRIKHVTAAGPSEGDTVLLYMCKKTTEEQKCHKTQVHYLTLGNAHTLTRYVTHNN